MQAMNFIHYNSINLQYDEADNKELMYVDMCV